MSNDEIKLNIACGQLKAAMTNQSAVEEYEKTRGYYEHKGWTLKPSESSKNRVRTCRCGCMKYRLGITKR